MKKLIILFSILLIGCAGLQIQDNQTAEYAIETMAILAGYDIASRFEWTSDTQKYYSAIMEGNVSLDGAQAAEAYLRTVTHPVLANRIIRLAEMCGFTLGLNSQVIGIENVNIPLLQTVAVGFKQGLEMAQVQGGSP